MFGVRQACISLREFLRFLQDYNKLVPRLQLRFRPFSGKQGSIFKWLLEKDPALTGLLHS